MAGFVVTVAEDVSDGDLSAGDLSLSEAIELANATAAKDTITFAADVDKITLHHRLPTITADLILRGGGAVTLDANATYYERRALNIEGADEVTIDGLTITGGRVGGSSSASGGGIRANDVGTLHLVNSTISDNTAARGGGVAALGGTALVVTDSVVSHNRTSVDGGLFYYHRNLGSGGGIYSGQEVTLVRTNVSGNQAYYGGGIASVGDVALTDCSIISNKADGGEFYGTTGRGGGVLSQSTVTVVGGHIAYNAAEVHAPGQSSSGGGISAQKAILQGAVLRINHASANVYHSGGTSGGGVSATVVEVMRSEVSGNTSGVASYTGDFSGGGINAVRATIVDSTIASNHGGGIFARQVTVTSSTISGNGAAYPFSYYAGPGGGGVQADTITVSNSLILGNFSNGNENDVAGEIHSDRVSIIEGDARDVFADTVRIAPGIFAGELEMNGGPTRTIALREDGLAIDAADPATAGPVDQRGVARGGTPDLGAFEHRGEALTILGGPSAERLAGQDAGDIVVGDGGNDRLYGMAGADRISGGVGHDVLFGGSGDDRLFGNAGRDRLFGNIGDDRLSGGVGRDALFGGNGHDVLLGSWGDDRLLGSAGHDRLDGDAGRDQLLGGGGDDLLSGGADRDSLSGLAGNDELFGGTGFDRLQGGDGEDVLSGGWGLDVLTGGRGTDILRGGRDADAFVFTAPADSPSRSGRDHIADFEHGLDRIDLRGIDASNGEPGNQAFTFIGSREFSAGDGKGEVRFEVGSLSGDVNDDGRADFAVVLYGVARLSPGDILS